MTRISLAAALVLLATACAHAPASGGVVARNEAVVRRLFDDVLSKGRWEVSEEIHAPGFVAHSAGRSFTREEDLASGREWRKAFPDLVVTVDQVVSQGDLVSVRFTGRGTNTGEGNGLPATGKRVEMSGFAMFRVVDGKIVEEWTLVDEMGIVRQLGMKRI